MRHVRQSIGGLGNLMFKQAFLMGKVLDGEIPDVYVQSAKYWLPHADRIRIAFSEGVTPRNEISLHVRRGDYLISDFYIDLTRTNYYQEAVKHFEREKFIVFLKDNQGRDESDRGEMVPFLNSLGIDWQFSPIYSSETDDLNLMASCKGHIMANSTFSWWGAFLGPGKTICPKEWFTDGHMRIDLLDEWIQL